MKKITVKEIIQKEIVPRLERTGSAGIIISQPDHVVRSKNVKELFPMFDPAKHYHNYFEICYVLENKCFLKLEDVLYELTEGEFCIVPPGTRHCEMLEKKGKGYKTVWFNFPGASLTSHIAINKNVSNFYTDDYIDIELPPAFLHIVPYIYDRFKSGKNEWILIAKGGMLGLFASVLDLLSVRKEPGMSWNQRLFSKAAQYIEKNYIMEITLEEIARHMGFSPNYFSSLFKKTAGISIFDYLNKVRVEKAKKLLLSPSYKIKEVSDLVGYSNPYYFSQVFKKLTKTSPEEFRKKAL